MNYRNLIHNKIKTRNFRTFQNLSFIYILNYYYYYIYIYIKLYIYMYILQSDTYYWSELGECSATVVCFRKRLWFHSFIYESSGASPLMSCFFAIISAFQVTEPKDNVAEPFFTYLFTYVFIYIYIYISSSIYKIYKIYQIYKIYKVYKIRIMEI